MDIEIPQSAGRVCLFTCAGAGERIHKKVEMADQMKRRLFGITCNIEHFFFQNFPHFFGMCMIDWCRFSQSCQFQNFFYAKSVKFDPHIFSGKLLVGDVGGDLLREDHKSLSAFDRIGLCYSGSIIGHQCTGSGDHIMEQIMISGSRTVGVGRLTLFPAELVQAHINKIFVWKNRKEYITHKSLLS